MEFHAEVIDTIMKSYQPTMEEYIVDVDLEQREQGQKVWLIDINPWIPVCVDSLLYSWEELEGGMGEPSIRVIEDQHLI